MSQESPTGTSAEGPKATTPTNSGGTTSATDAAGASTATPNSAAAAADPTGKKPTLDIDKLLQEAAKASSTAREKIREAETLKAKYGKYETLEAKKATSIREAIREFIGEGYSPQKIIEELSLDVEMPTDLSVKEQFAELLKQTKDAEAKAAAEKEAKDKQTREEQRAAESKAIQAEFLKEVDAFTDMEGTAEKFPICKAWSHKITADSVLNAFKTLVKAGQPCEPPDVMAALEAGFQAEIDATPFGKKPVNADPKTEQDYIDAEIERLEGLRKAKDPPQPALLRKDPNIPLGQQVPHGQTGKSVHEENEEFLDRLDRERDEKRRLSYG